MNPILPIQPLTAPTQAPSMEAMDVARDLEQHFLSEMLKHAGLHKTPGLTGGGAGEDQFSSLLRLQHAQQLTAAGGIGLAEIIAGSLLEANEK